MSKDMTVACENGFINIRVGAIIMKGKKFLMVGNHIRDEYFYSVGSKIKFGETAAEAVVREVFEETGVKMEIDRLGFVCENYFYGDSKLNLGKLVYEISYYFYMKTPADFEPVCNSFTEDDHKEYLVWIDCNEPKTFYPEFFRTELKNPVREVKYFLEDKR